VNGASPLQFADPAWIHAVWAAPAALVLAWWSIRGATRAMRRFADDALLGRLIRSVSPTRRWVKAALVAGALALLSVAIARPQTDPVPIEVEQHGRDIVFLVDVSRSMLATDLAPNRLDRAKLWVKDLVATREGDRIGLVAFAGAAVVKCPLTLDRTFFSLALDELSPRSAPVGGTSIGDAIRKTVREVFELDDTEPADGPVTRDIILITDGEDQESFPVEAAAAAGRAGVRIIAVGVGDSGAGSLVPDPDTGGPLYYNGKPVRSRLDADTLSEVAGATPGGAMLNVGTGSINLDDVYRDLTSNAALNTTGKTTTMTYTERFYVPLATALGLLLVESVIGQRRRRTG